MKKIFAFVMAVLLTLCGCSVYDRPIQFGTVGTGGMYNDIAQTLSDLAEAEQSVSIGVEKTAGSCANIRLISEGYIDAAIVQSDIASDAYYEKNSFAKLPKKYSGFSAVGSIYTEVCHIIVRKDSDIHSIDDLLGKTVSIGAEESGTEQNAKQILAVHGFDSDMVKSVNMDYEEAADKLKTGEIDAMFMTIGIGSEFIADLSNQLDIRIIDIDSASIEKLKSAYPFINCTIPKATYKGVDKDITTVGIRAIVVASDKLSSDKVYTLTRLIYDNADAFKNVQPNINTATQGVTIPFHSGAAKYFKEKGIEVKTAQ